MSFSGESEGWGGRDCISHPKVFKPCTLDQVHDCEIIFLMNNVLVNEIGHKGGVALGKLLIVNQILQRLR